MQQSIIQWNCNGYFAHLSELNLIINNHNPYILCIQETRFRMNFIPKSNEFNVYFKNNDNELNASGGVATYVHKKYKSEFIPIQSSLQVVACSVSYPINITICNIYLPPNLNYTKSDLDDIIKQLPSPFIICGDFNCHNPIWGSTKLDRKGRIVETIVNNFGLNIMNSLSNPTHFSAYLGTYSNIDLSICSPIIESYFAWNTVNDLHSSDHFPIKISLNNSRTIERRPKWKIADADWASYQLNADLTNLNSFNNCDDRNSFLIKTIIDSATDSIPKTSSLPKRRPVPWFTDEIRDAIKTRRKSLAIFKRYPTDINLSNFRKNRAICRKLIIQSKTASWRTFTSSLSLSTPSSDVWNKIRSLTNQYSPSTISSLICSTNNSVLSHDKMCIINELGTYFQSSFSTSLYPSNFLQPAFNSSLLLNVNSSLDKYSYNNPFTMLELHHSLNKSKGSSPGPDDVHYFMLKHLHSNHKLELLSFYNYIWNSRTFPNDWSSSFLVPILKPNKDPHIPSSYRPICLSSTVSKTMQRMVVERLSWIVEKEGLLSNNQYGFRKQRSTNDCLLILENAITKAFSSRQHCVAIFFDIEKAYDRTWKDGLLKTLYDWGFRGNMLYFVQHFLRNRSFRVMMENSKSALFHQTNGVPQGEILSVYLFLIAINSVAKFIPKDVEFLLYADDLTLFVSSKQLNSCKRRLQIAVDKLHNWSSATGLSFSMSKTKAVHFTRLRKHTDPIVITLNRDNIEFVESHKYLGMTFDKRLTWTLHIKQLKTHTTKQLNIMKCIFNSKWGADRDTLLRVYKSFIQPRIDYGCSVYSVANDNILLLLNTVLNLGARFSLGAFRSSPVISLICEAGLQPLSYRREQLMCSQLLKIFSKPKHPLNKELLNYRALTGRNNRRVIKSFIYRANNMILDLNIPTQDIMESKSPSSPPWSLNIQIHTELIQIPRQTVTYPNIVRHQHNEILQQRFADFDVFYTDGSRSSSYTSAAFYNINTQSSLRLHSLTSVFSSELEAILLVLKHILNTPVPFNHSILICSDSLSSVQSIHNVFSSNPYVRLIHNHIHQLQQYNIHFMWIPGHVGILGNEEADCLAKSAGLHDVDISTLSALDLYHHYKFSIKQKWEDQWSSTSTTVKLREIKESTKAWPPIDVSQTRKDAVVLSRIRIGHTHLTHSYFMTKSEKPICATCLTPISIKHIIEFCPIYNTFRQNNNIHSILQSAGDNQSGNTKILQFLKDAELYNLI